MEFLEYLFAIRLGDLPWILGVLHALIATVAGIHIILYKEPPQAAVGWFGVVLLSPFLGGALYFFFGINRIHRAATSARKNEHRSMLPVLESEEEWLGSMISPQARQLYLLNRSVHRGPVTFGNRFQPLVNGEEAYPRMLLAIESATECIALDTYIFDYDRVGVEFIHALEGAARRGVRVYVMIDSIGAHYSRQRVHKILKRKGVQVVRFMSPWRAQVLRFLNLRSHRKVLLVDGRVAFIGGMNIREGHMLTLRTWHPIRDLHFEVTGPVINSLNAVFVEDWEFAKGEKLRLPEWQGSDTPIASTDDSLNGIARAIPDGPDIDFQKLHFIFFGALNVAQKSIQIVTPYFLPNHALMEAILVASLRGVDVEIILPERSNLFYMNWAMSAQYEKLLTHGVKLYLSQPPFDHSKIFVVDGVWGSIGSANWDERSLRLNFELNLSVMDQTLLESLVKLFQEKKKRARVLTLDEVRNYSFLRRLRDRAVHLFSPYL